MLQSSAEDLSRPLGLGGEAEGRRKWWLIFILLAEAGESLYHCSPTLYAPLHTVLRAGREQAFFGFAFIPRTKL